jgi:hypothetical protein
MESGQSWPGKDEEIVIPVLARTEMDGIRTVLVRKKGGSYVSPGQNREKWNQDSLGQDRETGERLVLARTERNRVRTVLARIERERVRPVPARIERDGVRTVLAKIERYGARLVLAITERDGVRTVLARVREKRRRYSCHLEMYTLLSYLPTHLFLCIILIILKHTVVVNINWVILEAGPYLHL